MRHVFAFIATNAAGAEISAIGAESTILSLAAERAIKARDAGLENVYAVWTDAGPFVATVRVKVGEQDSQASIQTRLVQELWSYNAAIRERAEAIKAGKLPKFSASQRAHRTLQEKAMAAAKKAI